MRMQPRHLKYLKAMGITLLAFALSCLLLSPLTFSAASIMSSRDRNDFTVTDFYNHVADNRLVRTLDRDIVIVDIGNSDRSEIADVVEIVSIAGPKAVGMDVLFDQPRDSADRRLIAAMQACPNLVMATSMTPGRDGRFTVGQQSFFADRLPEAVQGVTNFPTTEKDVTIREFRVAYPAGTDSMPSFALALAGISDPQAAVVLKARDNTTEVINFCSRTFTVIRPEELIDRGEELTGRIVLIGSLNQNEDMHITPVKSAMTGIEIHAYALATVLNQSYFYKLNKYWNWAIAFISCFLVLAFSMFIPAGVKGITMRVFQIFILYLTIRYGYDLFIKHNVIVNFSYSLLMITFGLLANDFWFGTENLIKMLKPRLSGFLPKPKISD